MSSTAALRDQLRTLGVRPFQSQVVQSPWSDVHDADGLHQPSKDLINDVVEGCGRPNAIRCLTVTAPSGYGKTHLLAWNRQRLDRNGNAGFVYVPPHDPVNGSFDTHVFQAVLDVLNIHSPWLMQRLSDRVRSWLVQSYDSYLASGLPKRCLRAGSFWTRLLRPLSLRIGSRSIQAQDAALQRAFRDPSLLQYAFDQFSRQHPADPSGLRADQDTFTAMAMLVCGIPTHQYIAQQWLQNKPMSPQVWADIHVRNRCQGDQQIGNALFTLMHMIGLPFCIAFDQFESTLNAALNHPAIWPAMTQILYRIMSVPGFSLLFFVQASAWNQLQGSIPPMLHRRITEGTGVHRLKPLDDVDAEAVVVARMKAMVWDELASAGIGPPTNEPLFPFDADEVHQLRRDANSELHTFLGLLQDRYAQLIAPTPPPRPVIIALNPAQVPPHQPNTVRIEGQHFRQVSVRLAGQPINHVKAQPSNGTAEAIEITTPIGLPGDVEVRVELVDDPSLFATAKLSFVDALPRPYARNVDRQKMTNRRKLLKLNQSQFGDKVGATQSKISNFETHKWNPPDVVIEKMVSVLGGTLEDYK